MRIDKKLLSGKLPELWLVSERLDDHPAVKTSVYLMIGYRRLSGAAMPIDDLESATPECPTT
jgi:hypothetical protein